MNTSISQVYLAYLVQMSLAEEAKVGAETVVHPVPKWVRLHPEDGLPSVTIDTSSQEKSFRLPNNVAVNLGKSVLCFDFLYTAAASNSLHVHVDMLPLQRVKLELENGLILADVNNVNVLSKAYRPMVTSQEEYLSRQACRPAATVDTSFGYNTYLQPTGALRWNPVTALGAAAATVTVGTTYPAGGPKVTVGTSSSGKGFQVSDGPHCQYVLQAGTVSGPGIDTISAGHDRDSVCLQHVVDGAVGTTGSVAFRAQIKLEDILPSTILSNCDYLHFGQSMFLRLQFSPRDNTAWQSSSVTNWSGTTAVLTNSITCSNLVLRMMKDVNPITRDRIIDRVNKGSVEIQVPWIVSSLRNADDATIYSFQHHITPGWAKRLMRVITCFAHATASGRTMGCLDSVNGTVITSYQQLMDTTPIENEYVGVIESGGSTFGSDYWVWVSDIFKGSAIMTRRQHLIAFSIIANFTSGLQSKDWRTLDHSEDSGYLIDREMDFTVNVTKVGVAKTVYQFAVYLRKLRISKNNVTWE